MKQSGFGIASLTIGILSILFICCYGWFIAIPGIIFGIVGIAQKNRNHGTAIAGLICSIIGLITSIAMIIITDLIETMI